MPDRVLDQHSAALGSDHQARLDLAQLDHVGHLEHAGEQAEARVGDVVDEAVAGQAEPVVDEAGGGRFEEIAADRAVDDRPEQPAINSRLGDGPLGRFDAFSLGRMPGGQNRRWRMPVMSSSRPSGSRSRWYNGVNWASICSDVTISSGKV